MDRSQYSALPSRNLTFLSRSQTTARPSADESQFNLRGPTHGRTLFRPDRYVEPAPLIAKPTKKKRRLTVWTAFSWVSTCCCLPVCLDLCNIKGKQQQAWREKVALCWIAFLLSALVAFFIVGFGKVLCPDPSILTLNPVRDKLTGTIVIRGLLYNATSTNPEYSTLFRDAAYTLPGIDVTTQFNQPPLNECQNLPYAFASLRYPCEQDGTCLDITKVESTYGFRKIVNMTNSLGKSKQTDPIATFGWSEISLRKFKVYKTFVLNLQPYLSAHPSPLQNDSTDTLLRSSVSDLTLSLRINSLLENQIVQCLISKYTVGRLDAESGRCLFVNVLIYFTYIIVLGVTLVRFLLALFFDWFIASSLARDPNPEILRDLYKDLKVPKAALRQSLMYEEEKLLKDLAVEDVRAESDSDLYTVLLVTCYSEGEQSIRTTLESLASTEYNDRKKLLFIVADGLITGKGNKSSTPDIIVDMMRLDLAFGNNPKAYSYIAVATGVKQHNMAKVFCGHFEHQGRFIPTVVVIKCGTPDETTKPGNRGKRDSQIILMSFFNRVFLNDRMTPLDFDLFRKIHHISGVTPDFFEIVVMVDADTKVASNSLRKMVNCMQNDQQIMGLCGETLIANKRENWVTRIQVFEYYISHHLGKSFESIWGGVTCLPGCFCCYRLKSRKGNGQWVPILVNPDVLDQYKTNKTETLHEKNLLLLGEDRFLSTLMLRTFPRRKMVFTPDALCFTVVPDDFKTLVSQRRRWINSTVHNLMELVLVKNLCGTFCFSMQFVVFLDVLGTAVLPISLLLLFVLLATTIYQLIVTYVIEKQQYFDIMQLVPLFLLFGVLFLPAILVTLTSRHILSNLKWMGIYLLALPIWQIALPLYAFWNFDDFSWGDTRKVDGVDKGHEDDDDEFDERSVPLRKWEEYELNWRQNIIKSREISLRESSSSLSKHDSLSSEQTFRPRSSSSSNQIFNPRASASSTSTFHDQIYIAPPVMQYHAPVYDPRAERPSSQMYGDLPYQGTLQQYPTYLGNHQQSPYMITLARMPQLPGNMSSSGYNVSFIDNENWSDNGRR